MECVKEATRKWELAKKLLDSRSLRRCDNQTRNVGRKRLRPEEELNNEYFPATPKRRKTTPAPPKDAVTPNRATVYEKKWNDMFKKLSRFSRQNGHCDVPYRCKANPKLGEWVANQRKSYRRGAYNNKGDRIMLLESIGFKWGEAIDVPKTTCSAVKQPGRPRKPKEQKKAKKVLGV